MYLQTGDEREWLRRLQRSAELDAACHRADAARTGRRVVVPLAALRRRAARLLSQVGTSPIEIGRLSARVGTSLARIR